MRHPDPYLRFKSQHLLRPPKLTSVRWCKFCGGRHNGPCQVVHMPPDADHKTPYIRRTHVQLP